MYSRSTHRLMSSLSADFEPCFSNISLSRFCFNCAELQLCLTVQTENINQWGVSRCISIDLLIPLIDAAVRVDNDGPKPPRVCLYVRTRPAPACPHVLHQSHAVSMAARNTDVRPTAATTVQKIIHH